MRSKIVLAVTFLAALNPLPQASGQTEAPGGIPGDRPIDGVTALRLKNSVQLLIYPDPSANSVMTSITYQVGSRDEQSGETGVAHLVEHMMFAGTPEHPNITAEMAAHGTESNAHTDYDKTTYYEMFLSTLENLQWAIELEADRMRNSLISRESLAKEHAAVTTEWAFSEGNNQHAVRSALMASAYRWHPYGHDVYGTRGDVDHLSVDQVREFYRTYYRPDNATIIVSGRVDVSSVISLVTKDFGAIAVPSGSIPARATTEPVQNGERSAVVERPGTGQLFSLGYHIPSGGDGDIAPLMVLAKILGGKQNTLLYETLVESGKAANAKASVVSMREPGMFIIDTEMVHDAKLTDVREGIVQLLRTVATAPVTEARIDRAKADILRENYDLDHLSHFEVNQDLCDAVGRGDWRLFFLTRDRIALVTPSDIERVAKTYLKITNSTETSLIPTATPDVVTMPSEVVDLPTLLHNYEGSGRAPDHQPFDYSLANLERNISRITLRSGMQLTLLPKRPSTGRVTANLVLRYGDENSLQGSGRLPHLMSDMLLDGGAGFNRADILSKLGNLGANVTVADSPGQITVHLEVSAQNFIELLDVVGKVIESPDLSDPDLARVKAQELAVVDKQRADPISIGVDGLNRKLTPFDRLDPRHVVTPDEADKELTTATATDIKNFYSSFIGACGGELIVVGDFDSHQVEAKASSVFDSWKCSRPFHALQYPFSPTTPSRNLLPVAGSKVSVLAIGIPMDLSDDNEDYAAMVIGNEILGGGGGIGSKLFDQIRTKMGLCYGVQSDLAVHAGSTLSGLMIYAGCSEGTIDQVEDIVRKQLALALDRGFTEQEVDAAKNAWLQRNALSRGRDKDLASLLTELDEGGRTLVWEEKLEDAVSHLTAATLRTAMRKHIDPQSMVVVAAGSVGQDVSTLPR